MLSWHVQKFVAIWWPATELWQGKVYIEFELRAKNVSEMGPWFELWLNAEEAKSHNLNQWWLISQIQICFPGPRWVNSLAPGWFEWNFNQAVFKLILVTDGWGIFCETTLRWMSLDLTDEKSTLVQVMAWCRQATSHYLSQYWPRSLTPYGVTRPQWVKLVYQDKTCLPAGSTDD